MGRKKMPKKPVSKRNKLVGKFVAQVFGGEFQVKEYLDDSESMAVDILSCADRPTRGVTSYSTVGLSDSPIPWGDQEFPTRVELAGACPTSAQAFANVLASAAFRMLKGGGAYHPGAAIEKHVSFYFKDTSVPHLYLTTPFLWKGLTSFEAGTVRVTWLQAIPIADTEHKYLKAHGDRALEKLLRKQRVDICDLHRKSVV